MNGARAVSTPTTAKKPTKPLPPLPSAWQPALWEPTPFPRPQKVIGGIGIATGGIGIIGIGPEGVGNPSRAALERLRFYIAGSALNEQGQPCLAMAAALGRAAFQGKGLSSVLQSTIAGTMDTCHNGIHVFADGCFEPDSADGGWAFVAYRDGAEIAADFDNVSQTTNNSTELIAVLKATLWINGAAKGAPAVIWSDSAYAVKGCNHWRHIWANNGWKKIVPQANVRNRSIANKDLWKAIDHQFRQNPLITIAWCKGHSGIDGNERADELALAGRLANANSRRA
jgi:ribonuclease HI